MKSIAENIARLRAELPASVKLIAVSKTKSIDAINQAIAAGQTSFGENKAAEVMNKNEHIHGADWHFIGHLQTNKVKIIAPFVGMVQTVDSLRLLEEIDRQAQRNNRRIDCLFEVHIAMEEQKTGFREDELFKILENPRLGELQHVRICGLMGMATFTDDGKQIRAEFRRLATLHHQIKQSFFAADEAFCELSMGMSGDYHIAIEEGSTMVRIGTAIFGGRQ